jgi:hypothetical protein
VCRPVTNAAIAAITHSAIGSSNTPRAFVTMTSLAASAGKSSPSTPSLADWIQRSRDASPKRSSIQPLRARQKNKASASAIVAWSASASAA